MKGGNNRLVHLQVRTIVVHNGCTLYKYQGFVHFCFIVGYLSAGIAKVFIGIMAAYTGIGFYNHFVPVIHQHIYRLRREANTVFLECSFFWNADVQPFTINFYI